LKSNYLLTNNINQQTLDSFQKYPSVQPIFNSNNLDPVIPALPNSVIPSSYQIY
ncbi:unnamed protein product, partial [Brachionus calyciflorus]